MPLTQFIMKSSIKFGLLILSINFTTASYALPFLDGEAGGFIWIFEPSASTAVDIPLIGAGGADLISDLGFDGEETTVGLEGRIGDFFQLSINLMELDISSRQEVGFIDLVTDFKATFIRPMIGIDLDVLDQVGVGVHAGLQYIDQESSLVVSPFGAFSTDDPALLPVIGAHAFAEADGVRAQLRVVYSSLDFEDVVANFYDVEAAIHFYLGDTLYLGAAFRQLQLEYEEELLDLEVKLNGPMIKAGFRW